MSRPKPTVTAAQKLSITQYSRLQADNERRMRTADALYADLKRGNSASREALSSTERTGKTLARIFVLPITLVTVAYLLMLCYGLWSGELPHASKYSEKHVYRTSEPMAFWIQAACHTVIAAMFSVLSFRLIRSTGWFRSNAT